MTERTAGAGLPSLRVSVAWALVANGVTSASTWLMLLALTRLAGAEVVGTFALSQAVALPIHMFFTFKMRVVQSTDHRSEYSEEEYRHFRTISAMLSLAVTTAIALTLYDGELRLLIVIMALGYSVVIYREYFIALLQRHERNDRIALSNLAHGLAALGLFVATFVMTRSIAAAVAAIFIARVACTILVDRPLCAALAPTPARTWMAAVLEPGVRSRFVGLLKVGVPLGTVALLGTLFTSVPRLVLEQYESLAAVGYYSALASLLVVLNLFVSAVSQSVTPRLARLWDGDGPTFVRAFARLFLWVMLGATSAVALSRLFGARLLALMFGPKYAVHEHTFFLLMIAAAALTAFALMNMALSAQRLFTMQLPIYAACAAAILLGSYMLVPRFGMDGAAYAYGLTNGLGFGLCCLAAWRQVRRRRANVAI